MRRIPGSPLFALSMLLLWPLACAAQRQPPVVLDWRDDGSCAAPADAEQQLRSILGSEGADGPPRQVLVTVKRAATDRYELTITSQHGASQSRRALELGSCAELQETAVLLMALGLEPQRNAPAVPTPAAEPRPARPVRWGLSAHAGADFTSLPAVAPLGSLGGAAQLSSLRLYLQARYLGRSTSEDLPAGSEAWLDILEVAPGSCFLWPLSPLSLGMCAELALGRVRGRADGVEGPKTQHALWATASAGALLEYWPTAAVSLQIGLFAGPLLTRPQFALVGQPPFHELPPALVRAMFGITLWLPTKEPRPLGH